MLVHQDEVVNVEVWSKHSCLSFVRNGNGDRELKWFAWEREKTRRSSVVVDQRTTRLNLMAGMISSIILSIVPYRTTRSIWYGIVPYLSLPYHSCNPKRDVDTPLIVLGLGGAPISLSSIYVDASCNINHYYIQSFLNSNEIQNHGGKGSGQREVVLQQKGVRFHHSRGGKSHFRGYLCPSEQYSLRWISHSGE
jgi:hypothetical protein